MNRLLALVEAGDILALLEALDMNRFVDLVEAGRVMWEQDFPEGAAAAPPPQPPARQRERTWRVAHAEMAGGEVVAIGAKRVKPSDVNRHQGRLLLTRELKEGLFQKANEDETNAINSRNGLLVTVLDHGGGRHHMKCRYRRSHRGVVFNGGWMGFVGGVTHLQEGDWLDISVFRSEQGQGELCFIFLPRQLDNVGEGFVE